MMKIRIQNSNHQHWPTWFSIKNYRVLSKLTWGELLAELEFRLMLFHAPNMKNGQKKTDTRALHQIETGKVILRNDSILNRSQYETKHAVTLNLADLDCLSREYKNGLNTQQRIFPSIIDGTAKLILQLDLANANNSTLLKEIEFLISSARAENNIPEPCQIIMKKTGIKTLKKILDYEVIAYLDLCIYSQAHRSLGIPVWQPLHFTQQAYIDLLFEGDSDPEHYKKTILPFYNDIILNDQALTQLIDNARNNIWNQPIETCLM